MRFAPAASTLLGAVHRFEAGPRQPERAGPAHRAVHAKQALERDETRWAVTTDIFLLVPRTQRSASAAGRGPLTSAWGCFRDFFARPCRAPPKRRYAGSGTRDR